MHDHAIADGRLAGGDELGNAFDLDQTYSTGSRYRKPRMVAILRQGDASIDCGLQDHLSGLGVNAFSVNGDLGHRWGMVAMRVGCGKWAVGQRAIIENEHLAVRGRHHVILDRKITWCCARTANWGILLTMDFIRRFIEQRISRATGSDVRFGKISFSPFTGGVEVLDLCVGDFLAVKRIEAKIAVARALNQEIVVRSLAIEAPVLTINRRMDGTTNLPPRPQKQQAEKSPETKTTWEFEAQKVLLVSGKIVIRDAGGYLISLDNLTGSIDRNSADESDFVLTADSVGRRDKIVNLGQAQLIGKLASGLNLTLCAGSMLDLNVRTASIDSGRWEGEIILAMSLAMLLSLLPPQARLPVTSATGDARLLAVGSFDRASGGFDLKQFELKTGPVTLR
jgi:hypothetical protein